MRLCVLAAVSVLAPLAAAQTVLNDQFDKGPSALWGNERGAWTVFGSGLDGRYGATLPNNDPLTYSSLPYNFTDFAVTAVIRSVDDGGIWLRADAAGQNGVLLVFARGDIYWHRVIGGFINPREGLVNSAYARGSNITVQTTVVGNVYSAYLNGALTPTTTLNTPLAATGRVGLYDFTGSGHDYDSVQVQGSCVAGCCQALVSRHPDSLAVCESSTTRLRCEAAGSPGFTYAWQVEDPAAPSGWRFVNDGPLMITGELVGTVTGATAADFALQNTDSAIDLAKFRCIVSNSCGSATSLPATVTIRQCSYGACAADYDASGGTPDSSDISEFFTAWLEGADCADVDCSGGTPDSSDISSFFTLWLAGGC
jgi:hypothetical protein